MIRRILIAIGWPIYSGLKLIFILTRRLLKGVRWKWLFPTIILLVISGVVGWFYKEVIFELPNVNEIYNPPKISTKILDRNGKILYKFYEDENRSWVNYDKIPNELILATIAIEDKTFFKHHGFSVKGMIKAAYYNFFKKDTDENLRGGSTITQQLVKNVFLTNEKTFKRKLKEAVLAVLIEKKLSKEEILERYFNQVPYGGEAYGVEEASIFLPYLISFLS